ncbi:MAG: RNHCP domain-containing protein [bacterium]
MVNQPRKFQRKFEDFICDKCGTKNIGNGFTNHCFNCLWSKHVDINPGDRAESCWGMMEPIKIDSQKGKYFINFKCVKCGIQKRKGVEKNDNFEAVIAIVEKSTK